MELIEPTIVQFWETLASWGAAALLMQLSLMVVADSRIALELRVWLSDPQEGVGNVRSAINLAIWHGFKEAGVTIPYPQRDVHVRQVVTTE